MKNNWIGIAAIAFFVGVTGGVFVTERIISSDPGNFKRYTDPAGAYSFIYPNDVLVACSGEECVLRTPAADGDTGVVPDITVKINKTTVEFQTWENKNLDYFTQVVSSFKFK